MVDIKSTSTDILQNEIYVQKQIRVWTLSIMAVVSRRSWNGRHSFAYADEPSPPDINKNVGRGRFISAISAARVRCPAVEDIINIIIPL